MNKTIIFLLVGFLAFQSCKPVVAPDTVFEKKSNITGDTENRTNDFYDNADTKILKGSNFIEIAGEVANPRKISFDNLPLRSVIVKETVLNEDGKSFVGAYRYDGYSIHDILNLVKIEKGNADSFRPIVDLYVEISNDNGEKIVLSWGEIYFPIHLHECLIATGVMHIVPHKTKDYWPLPDNHKMVVASDLITARNISNPTKITIKHLEVEYEVNKGMNPMWSDKMRILDGEKVVETLTALAKDSKEVSVPTIFYGRGKGLHGVNPMRGTFLKDLISPYFPMDNEKLKTGIFVICALDGYRASFTYSEIFNRNDFSEILIIDKDNYEGAGKFSLFPTPDFFSDRALKSVKEIRLLQ